METSTKILTKREVVEMLRLSERTVDSLRQRKSDPLPALKVGAAVRFDSEAVLGWLQRQTGGTR